MKLEDTEFDLRICNDKRGVIKARRFCPCAEKKRLSENLECFQNSVITGPVFMQAILYIIPELFKVQDCFSNLIIMKMNFMFNYC